MPETPAPHDHFAPLRGAEFIVLTTYRRTGAAVPTTVWFAEAGGVLYLTTGVQAGKAKRLRANPAVQVAPSDQVGNVQGPALAGCARMLEPHEDAAAIAALQQKYGEPFTRLTARMDEAQPTGGRIYIIVMPLLSRDPDRGGYPALSLVTIPAIRRSRVVGAFADSTWRTASFRSV